MRWCLLAPVLCSIVWFPYRAISQTGGGQTPFPTPQAESRHLTFSNFKRQVTLTGHGDFFRTENNLLVTLSGNLIVKGDRRLTHDALSSLVNEANSIKQLYVAASYTYYLVEVSQTKTASLLTRLVAQPGVLLVQPDMLQLGYPKPSASSASDRDSLKVLDAGDLRFAHGGEGGHEHQPVSEVVASRRMNKGYVSYLQQLQISRLWERSLGEGIRIAIIDDGIRLNHPAFKTTKSDFLYSFTTHSMLREDLSVGAEHGTRVAGIIFAAHDNNDKQKVYNDNNSIKGIAPEAELIAIAQRDTLMSNILRAFYLAKLNKADVVNCSWNSYWLLQPEADVIEDLALSGRNGSGAAVIFAAGNEGRLLAQNAVEASLNKAIVVGATNIRGQRLKTSNYGPSVDIQVFGQRVRSTAVRNDYARFSGTSLSAAITSGVAALLLAGDREMTLTELQDQLQRITGTALSNERHEQQAQR